MSEAVDILQGLARRSRKGGLKRNKDALSSDPDSALVVSKAVVHVLSSVKESAAAASVSCIA